MAEERVVVEVDLGVEREELVVLCGDEGIDLEERRIGVDEGAIEALEEADRLADLRGLEAEREGELARLPCPESNGGIDRLFENGSGSFRGDFFDLHAAGLRGHENQLARCAVENDAEVELAIDRGGFFNQQ